MHRPQTTQQKGPYNATVESNILRSGKFGRLTLRLEGTAAQVFRVAKPGQFAQFDVSNLRIPPAELIPDELVNSAKRNVILRRPLSLAGISDIADAEAVLLDILYCIVGPGSLRLSTAEKGDRISLIGPLGRGFFVPAGKKLALLVAGGMGAPPLQHLAGYLREKHKNIEVLAFAGAKTITDLPYFDIDISKVSDKPDFSIREFSRYAVKSLPATDDGSAGFKGFVTECMRKWLDANKIKPSDAIIYACGPELMLKAAADLATDYGIDCQVSLEQNMACGTGLCQSCAVKCCCPNGEKIYKLCCKDGPVFDSREVVWE